jgi:glutaminyl-peptide cyclotransferase
MALLVVVIVGCGARPAPAPPSKSAAAGSGGAPSPAPLPAEFDPDSAWAALTAQLAFGPRVPGTDAHKACAAWLAARLAACGGRVERDAFTYRDPAGTDWPLENIIGRFGPGGGARLLLVAHWDTRPWADEDADPALRTRSFPGANDGASGVAVLLELARVFSHRPPPGGVDLLFADGEDLGRSDNPEGFCRGTRRFAQRGVGDYERAIVLDMVGDIDLSIPIEQNSLRLAPDVVDWVWERGRKLEPEIFTTRLGSPVFDDHIPLIEAGLPTVDVIDFDYPFWHTSRDDISHVSAASLGSVGRVMLSLVMN